MDSIDGFQFNNCVGQFMDTFGTKDHLNERYRLKDRYLIRSNEYWNMIDQDGSGVMEKNEFRDIVMVFAWIDANVLFKCNQHFEKHKDFCAPKASNQTPSFSSSFLNCIILVLQ